MYFLNSYDEILQILAEIPVLPCLLSSQHANRPEFRDGVSLLEWISAQDHKNSLQDIVTQCSTAIGQFDESVMQGVMNEVFQVREDVRAKITTSQQSTLLGVKHVRIGSFCSCVICHLILLLLLFICHLLQSRRFISFKLSV